MGAGKSTVGGAVAARARVPFADLDAVIGDVPAIFAAEGEVGFRAREREALSRLVSGAGVIALGGGTLVDPRNRAALEGWMVVVLMAPREVLAARVGTGEGRPLAAQLDRLLAERAGVWALCGPVVETGGRDIAAVVDEVLSLCRTSA
ncbi:MAG: shikimate kinase [Deltaproteobacteria bacterium]|nr:shikimate kinase [Deltaproteobacteria bacterium]